GVMWYSSCDCFAVQLSRSYLCLNSSRTESIFPSRSSQATQRIDSDRNRVGASRSELHKNHPAKTVVFCRGEIKMKRVHIKLLIRMRWRRNAQLGGAASTFPTKQSRFHGL